MKRDAYRGNKGHGGPPLRLIEEMAEEFGLTKFELVNLMRMDPTAPKHAQQHQGPGYCRTYYNPIELRRWWRARQAAKAALLERVKAKMAAEGLSAHGVALVVGLAPAQFDRWLTKPFAGGEKTTAAILAWCGENTTPQ